MSAEKLTIIHSATMLSDGATIEQGWVTFGSGRIRHTGEGSTWRALDGLENAEIIDAAGQYLAPGFIDMHGHGGGGAAYDGDAEAITTAMGVHLAHGTTRQVLSLVANPVSVLCEQMATIADAAADNPRILGVHLEGPFMDIAHKGAHEPRFIVDPTPDAVAALIDGSRGLLRQVTLAPELPGGLDAVEQFVRSGAAVAVGHSNADYATTLEAFRRGASILTHSFNAMNPILHRAPGPVVAALDTPSVTLEAIADGVHVHPSVLRLLFDSAPERVALVTDSMAATGMADGDYLLGTLPVTVVDGVARLDSGAIAGSTLTLDRAVRIAVEQVGVTVAEAVASATSHPARALGIDDKFGLLEPRYVADAVLLNRKFEVQSVWVAGERAI